MAGFVVVTHGRLGEELIATAEQIVGKLDRVKFISIAPDSDPEKVRGEISRAIDSVDHGEGVLIFTDLFGGTPSNLSISFLDEKKVEVVTGVNLPMIMKLSNLRKKMDLDEMAKFIRSYGRENISVAGELLKGH